MLLLGNALSLIGCALMIVVGLVKKKKHMLVTQTVQFSFQSLGNLVLGSINGFFSCVLSVVRIFVFSKFKVTVWLKLAFIAIQLSFTLYTGADTIFEWLPFMSTLAYTWYLDTENPVTFKIVNLIGTSMWVFHDFHYRIYTAFTFDILTVISMLIGIAMLQKDKRKSRTNT